MATKESDEIRSLIEDEGLNLIPVRQRSDEHNKEKTPYKNWTRYQSEKISADQLFSLMYHHDTKAVAVVCGAVSGNLEDIDVDVKFKPGIDAFIFKDLQDLYPELFLKLRIDRTPSGGFHLLYKVADPLQLRTRNLAERLATPQELLVNPRRSKYCFIELKSEGGLSQMPPSPGYTIHQNNKIPTITWQERCSIINLMCSYTEIIEQAKPHKPTKAESDYYDENPFDHFNGSDAAAEVLDKNGWKPYKRANGNFIYFTHPESKNGGVHASFNKKTGIYRIFTSSSDFDPDKFYNASTALSILEHGGDKKKTFRYLVDKGYGKINPDREASLAKRSATNNKPLPNNISTAGAALHAVISSKLKQQHPFGVFWAEDDENKIVIDRHALYQVCEKLGFMLFKDELVKVVERIIYKQTERDFYDTIRDYIKEDDTDLYKSIINSYEPFIERHGRFTITRMPIIDEEDILIDTRSTCFKYYIDCVVEINSVQVIRHQYSDIKKLIWHTSIKQREYNAAETGVYIDFLKKAIGINDFNLSCIGYLCHQFKDETTPYIIALPEECENPNEGGGSGKNIFCRLFENTTSFSSRSGEQISYDVKFLQSWKKEKIFCISDPPKDFRWSFLKDLSDQDGLIKNLFKDEAIVKSKDMPKFLVPTNFGVDLPDGGVKRRIRQIEFTDFFTKAGGIDTHYGCHFPNGWGKDDWAGYDHIITIAIQKWLKGNLKIATRELSDGGWSKQFEQTYGPYITGFIKDYWPTFINATFVTNEQFKVFKETYINENDIGIRFKPSTPRINAALNEWATKHGHIHNKDARDRKTLGEPRGHSFFAIDEPPF